jgi:hypothetical protein
VVLVADAGVGVVSRTVETGGAACEVEVEEAVAVVVSGGGFGTSSSGRDLGGSSSSKNDFFFIVCVCMWEEEGRDGEREFIKVALLWQDLHIQSP